MIWEDALARPLRVEEVRKFVIILFAFVLTASQRLRLTSFVYAVRARVGEVRGEDTRCYIDRDPDPRVTWDWGRLEPCSWVEGGTAGSLVRVRCARLERWL